MIITPNSKRKLPLESGQSYGSSKKRRSIKKNLVLELLPNALFGGSSTPVPGNTALYNQNGWRKKIRRLKRGCAECSPSFLLFRIHGPRCFRIPELLPECIVLNWEVQQAVCQLCKEKEQTTESPACCQQVHACMWFIKGYFPILCGNDNASCSCIQVDNNLKRTNLLEYLYV